jgi:ABC-2 type transport system permease protein
MLRRILTLIYKEFLAVWRDKKSRTVLIVPPILQLFIFAFAATLDVKNVPIGILNRDNGEHSIELIQRFMGSPFFSSIIFLKSVDEITPFIDLQRGAMVVSIDEQFSISSTRISPHAGKSRNSKRGSSPAIGLIPTCYIIGTMFRA